MEDTAIERDRTRSTRTYPTREEIPARGNRCRSGRKPPRILGLWARVTLLGITVVMMVLAAVGLVAKAIRPYREASLQSQQLRQTKSQINDLDNENASLRRRIAYLKTTDGIVVEARKMGYMKPGEIPFVVEGQDSGDDTPVPASPVPPPAAAPSRLRGLWHRLTGH